MKKVRTIIIPILIIIGAGCSVFNPEYDIKWRYNTKGYVTYSPAIGEDGTIYFVTFGTGDEGDSDCSTVFALDWDGNLAWKYVTGHHLYQSPSIDDNGTIYCASLGSSTDPSRGYILAINPDGSLKWSYAYGGAIQTEPETINQTVFYFGANDSYLYALGTYPEIILSTTIVSIGTVSIGSSGSRTFTISNVGDADLIVSSITSDNG